MSAAHVGVPGPGEMTTASNSGAGEAGEGEGGGGSEEAGDVPLLRDSERVCDGGWG